MAHAQKRSTQFQVRPWWLTSTLIGYLAGKSLPDGWRAKYSPYLDAQKKHLRKYNKRAIFPLYRYIPRREALCRLIICLLNFKY